MYLLVLDQKSNLLDFPALWQCCGVGFRGRTAGLVLRGTGGRRRLDTGIRLLAQNLFCTLDSVQGIGLVAQNLFYASGLLRRCCKVLLMEEILHHFKWPSTAETPRPRFNIAS